MGFYNIHVTICHFLIDNYEIVTVCYTRMIIFYRCHYRVVKITFSSNVYTYFFYHILIEKFDQGS